MNRNGIVEDPLFLDDEERDDIRAAERSIAARKEPAADPEFPDRKRCLEAAARATLAALNRTRSP
ncbi:MAG: hypothetical protein F4204_12985 [Rhodospirillaceae bacterium]|nr:hypothetical protein [Rhodospirillaceae bacterium]MYG53218.1 hypothetical protein [Rhodospirillaceae bacterium]